MRRGIASVLGTTLGVAITLVFIGQAEAKDRYDVGEQVPVFTLKVLNGDDSGESYVSLDKYYGSSAKDPKKAVLVSFFATYCKPCKKEMPYLAALYDTYKEKGLQILLVTIDKEAEKIEEAKALAKEKGVKFPLLTDRFNIVARRYFIEKLPCVYILDANGKVSMVNVGYDGDVSKTLLDEIRTQLGEPTSDPIPEALVAHMNHGGDSKAEGTTVASADTEGTTETADGSADAGTDSAEATNGDDKKAVAKPVEKEKKKKKKRKKRKKRRK